MAITSSAITVTGKAEVTKLLTNLGTPYSYAAIGVGNGDTAATENTTTLLGDELKFKSGNASYFTSANGSYISQWNSTFVYADLTTHIFKELSICENATNQTSHTLLRGVYDAVTLGSDDSLSLTIQVNVDEG